jgi:cellobiose-specific phosphotransferase system component IIC
MTLSPTVRGLIAAVPFVLAAALAVMFDVVREIPVGLSCDDETPAGYDAAVAAYRHGAIALHLAVIAVTLAAIALLSRGHDGPLGFSRQTVRVTAVLTLLVVALEVTGERALSLLAPLFVIVIGLVIVAQPLGAQATAVIAALALLAASVWIYRGVVDRDVTRGPRAALWALALLTGAHLVLVQMQGEAPFLC